ncbi:hypothetical protein NDU88_002743 [Pleurodeles waltl]|uniref:Uncharacterized protein n=1 Tax=Pleurodeles waltl TaxID=8319 RepID=A0AAV7LDB8_PLEWA|nr:hypothetical protein NDU88_002743 [Pleurodeles waltl]
MCASQLHLLSAWEGAREASSIRVCVCGIGRQLVLGQRAGDFPNPAPGNEASGGRSVSHFHSLQTALYCRHRSPMSLFHPAVIPVPRAALNHVFRISKLPDQSLDKCGALAEIMHSYDIAQTGDPKPSSSVL